MKTEVIISIIIGVLGVILFTGLLVAEKFGAPTYIILISILALVCLVIPVLQRLRELDLKNLKLTLHKIKEVKAEIFAKEEALKESTLLLSELITVNTALSGIWGDANSTKYRKELVSKKTKDLLHNLNVPESQIEEIFKYQKSLDNIPKEAGEEHDLKWKEFMAMLKKESGN